MLTATKAPAPETDNFYLPFRPEFADLGDVLNANHTQAIEEAVRKLNGRIERALKIKNPESRAKKLAHYHSPEAVAAAVAGQFGDAITEILRIDHALGGADARKAHPNKRLIYNNISMNLFGHFPLDPRALLMVGQAGTVRAYGTYFGTDKVLHFHQLGYHYYKRYRALLRKGVSPEMAHQNVVRHFSRNAFLAEAHVYGTLLTGVYSNADLASDYLGMKFFLNLTEFVRLRGEERPPLVVRDGELWKLNDHVRAQSDWFRYFISDHWNEALNPCLYDWTMRVFIRNFIRHRAKHIIEFYTRIDGRPNDPAYFEMLAHTLSTYYGESYGHSGSFEELMTIGNTCYPAIKE